MSTLSQIINNLEATYHRPGPDNTEQP
jgi:hypothetical protein